MAIHNTTSSAAGGGAAVAPSQYDSFYAALGQRNIPALNGIRAISVFLVIFYHLGMERGLPLLPGPLGVLAFFVLSGFLITWLLLKEYDQSGAVSLRGFYQRRALRIFPAFYTFWILSLALRHLRGGDIPWSQAWTAFFYISNYHHAIFRPEPAYMMHTWSLAVEEQFYLLWPLAFMLLISRPRTLMAALTGTILAVWAYRCVIWSTLHARDYLSYSFDSRMDALLVGCLLAVCLRLGVGRSFLSRVCAPVWAPAVTVFVLAVSSMADEKQSYRLTCGLGLEAMLVAILLCQVITHHKTVYWGWLNSRVIAYLGILSYPLYLYHGMASAIAERITGSTSAYIVTSVVVSILLAALSFHFLERPFLALKDRLPRTASSTTTLAVPQRSASTAC
jgi:peptidoglycan/LPS O-acetylase OafA/YrhL